MYQLFAVALLLRVAAAGSVPLSSTPVCSRVATASCSSYATSYCSSYLHIPAKTTTSTTTASFFDFTTVVITNTKGTATSRVPETTVTTTLGGTVTQTVTTTTTAPLTVATTTVTQYDSSSTSTYYALPAECTITGTPSPSNNIKRGIATVSPTTSPTTSSTSSSTSLSPIPPASTTTAHFKPPCLKTFATGAPLSSACSCLSFTTKTATHTKTVTPTITVTSTDNTGKTTTVDVTVTRYISTAGTVTTTATATSYSFVTATSTYTAAAQTETVINFWVNAVQNGVPYFNGTIVNNATSSAYNLGFDSGDPISSFYLTDEPQCYLQYFAGPDNSVNQYTAYWDPAADDGLLIFQPPNTPNLIEIECLVNVEDGQLFCGPNSGEYNSGYIVDNSLYFGASSPPGCAVTISSPSGNEADS